LPESSTSPGASEATDSGGAPAAAGVVGGGCLGAGLRGRACCDGRMNLHANTTAMANPATAPSDPALWENKSGATHSHTHTESQSVRVRALGGGGGGSPAGSRGMLGEGNPHRLYFTLPCG
jgi:hypothetical protein